MWKAILIIFPIALILTLTIAYSNEYQFLKDFYFPLLSVLSGILIAVAGIFIGGISTLINKTKQDFQLKIINKDQHDKIISSIDKLKCELKDNVVFSLASYLIGAFFLLLKTIDIPCISWPIRNDITFLNKGNCLNFLICICLVSTIYAVFDTINAMFKVDECSALP